MPAAIQKTPHKRLLSDATNTRANHQASPRSAKKLKFDNGSSQNGRKTIQVGPHGSFNSSQPAKSRFEEEVLEKMSQDLTNLKQTNTEKDQHWSRPPLTEDWEDGTHSLCFQQIEAEEGQLNGGKTTVKLFGVTEVSFDAQASITWLIVHC
jgi:DNA polymerase delta subunit 1